MVFSLLSQDLIDSDFVVIYRLRHTASVHGIKYSLLFSACYAHLTQYFLHFPYLVTPPGHFLTVSTNQGKEESALMMFHCKKKGKNTQKTDKKRAQIPNSSFLCSFYDKTRHVYCPYEM